MRGRKGRASIVRGWGKNVTGVLVSWQWVGCSWGRYRPYQQTLHLWEGQRGGGRLPVIGEHCVFSITGWDSCPSGASASSDDAQFPGWMGHLASFWRSLWLIHYRCVFFRKRFCFLPAQKLLWYVAVRGQFPRLLGSTSKWLRGLQCAESCSHTEELRSDDDEVVQPQRLLSCLLEMNTIWCPEPLSIVEAIIGCIEEFLKAENFF